MALKVTGNKKESVDLKIIKFIPYKVIQFTPGTYPRDRHSAIT